VVYKLSKRCENYSIENKQCKFNYDKPCWVNPEDLNPRCDGFKSPGECTWFKGYHLDIAGNDVRLRKFRARLRNEKINCGEVPCEFCYKYGDCLNKTRRNNGKIHNET
jgi:hypothetical protein